MSYLTKEEMAEETQRLKQKGYVEDDDFFVETMYRISLEYNTTVVVIAGEYEVENKGGARDCVEDKDWRQADSEFICESSRQVIGYRITNIRGDPFNEKDTKPSSTPEKCAVCGMTVKLRGPNDARIEHDGAKCYEHLGVPSNSQEAPA